MNAGTITMRAPGLRYDRVAVALHWVVGLGVLAQLCLGWLLGEIDRGTPGRALAINLHKSTGLVLALLIVLRLAWRLRHRPPAYAPQVDGGLLRLARLGHLLLYACMVCMPLSGYLASNFSKHGIRFFNRIALPPWGPDDKDLYTLFNGAHDVLAVVFSAVVAAHIGAALYHGYLARDGVLARMSFGPRRAG